MITEMITELMTIRDMAEAFQEPPKRIEYLISKHRIREKRRIGATRVFGEQEQVAIKQALFGIQIRSN